MIHINLKDENQEDYLPPNAWLVLVQQYNADLENNNIEAQASTPKGIKTRSFDLDTSNGRKDYFNFLGELWNQDDINLKEEFFENNNIVGSKCWYSEVDSVGAELEIEHFRPKGMVSKLDYTEVLGHKTWNLLDRPEDTQLKRETGYYWLTYNWKNYRLSCKTSNTIKSTYFPLLPKSNIALAPKEEGKEIPVLLDPLIASDTELVSFEKISKDEVKIVPSVSLPIINGVYHGDKESFKEENISDEQKWNYLRAEVSIWVFELNKMKKIQKARAEVWNDTEDLFKKIINDEGILKDIEGQIKIKVHKLSKHAAVARQVVSEFWLSGKISKDIYDRCLEDMNK